MRKQRITDSDAEKLLAGRAPTARPELEQLAESLSEFRAAAFESAPWPSAELAARLDLARASSISQGTVPLSESGAATAGVSPRSGRVKRMFGWFAGLSILAKVALSAGVALAAVTAVGSVGALPPGAQGTFDTVVSVVGNHGGSDDATPSPSPSPTNTGEPADDSGVHSTEPADDSGGHGTELGDTDDTSGSGDKSGSGDNSGSGDSLGSDDSGSGDSGSESGDVGSDDGDGASNSGSHSSGSGTGHNG